MAVGEAPRFRVRLYLRGGIWWTWHWIGGKQIRLSTGRRSRRDAEVVARQLELDSMGKSSPAAKDPSVMVALGNLAESETGWAEGTRRAHRSRARTLAYYLGQKRCGSIDKSDLDSYVGLRRRDGASDHSIHKEICLLGMALRNAGSELRYRHPPKYRPRERFLERSEVPLLLAELDPDRQWWLRCALATGARLSELHGLDWSDIDLHRGLLRVRGTKTSSADRTLPIPPGLLSQLSQRQPKAGRLVEHWTNARRDLLAACKRAGIPPVSPNDLRRTCASWMVQAGVAPQAVAGWLGHRSLDMVARVYGRLNPESLRQAALSVPAP